MRTEYKVFGVVAAFLLLLAAMYRWWTGSGSPHPEGAGRLGLSGVLALLSTGYFRLFACRMPPRPEDTPDAEIADGAGPIGFFAPPGFWPFGPVLIAALLALDADRKLGAHAYDQPPVAGCRQGGLT
ncbi:aa3-type cytochrome oxidase subunit IV [Dactylosporangium sp. CA-139114]|uniref:aa3-type cytochrome oxidase subunit IV n=1 Tax=Dactylosporangium sp. CA-139114 TaxID=3239931 RepID=UPI003D95DD2F